LEKYIYRKIKAFNQLNYSNDSHNEIIYIIQYQIPNFVNINRKDSYIDDDMICITFTINDSSIKYDINRFRLKKIEDITIKSPPNMYHRGNYIEYDWEVLTYTYEI
jgi:hypothetical protein